MAQKILAITGNVTVTPLQGMNPAWHDLAYEISQWNDVENPYAFAILLVPGFNTVYLTAAQKYKLSDGQVITTAGTYTIGPNEAGRESKLTKYIIFRTNTPYFTQNFSSYPNISMIGKILMVYNLNNDLSEITFNGCYIPYFFNDIKVTNPIIFNGVRKPLVLKNNHFSQNRMTSYTFPQFAPDATDAEKTINIPDYAFSSFNALSDIIYPTGLLSLTLNNYIFLNCNFTSIILPSGLNYLYILGSSIISSNPNFAYLFISKPSLGFKMVTGFGGNIGSFRVELENNWNFTIVLNSTTLSLTSSDMELYILNKLADYRSTNGEDVYVTISSNSLVTWNATDASGNALTGNANWIANFHVGETVIVNIAGTNRSYTIQNINSNNQMVMTNSANMVAGTYLLNNNKIVTLGATNLAQLSITQIAIATTKKWQLT
jgi:hypothetical protein